MRKTTVNIISMFIMTALLFCLFSQIALCADEKNTEANKLSFAGDKLKFNIDFRYRHEQIDQQDFDMRTRHRFRLRFGVEAEATDEISLGLKLASGSDDPVSTNQTLGNSFSSKGIWIDLAYFDYHPNKIKGLNLIGGKMENPFFLHSKSELIWDTDLNPEGLAFKYKYPWESIEGFINGGGFWLKERSSKMIEEEMNDNDTGFLGGQGGLKFDLSELVHFTLGTSYFQFIHMASNKDQWYETLYIVDDGFGNSTFESNDKEYYIHDYKEIELFAEFGFKAGKIPISLWGNYVNNLGVENNNWYAKKHKEETGESLKKEDTGWVVGFLVGKCKDKHSWEVRYNYRELEADAVVGILTDSDFRGGGTDAKGHEINIGYQIFKNLNIGFSFFHNKIGLNLDENEEDTTYRRYQLDIEFKI